MARELAFAAFLLLATQADAFHHRMLRDGDRAPPRYSGPFAAMKNAGSAKSQPNVVYNGGRVWWQPMDVAFIWYGPGWANSTKNLVHHFTNTIGASDWWAINTQVRSDA